MISQNRKPVIGQPFFKISNMLHLPEISKNKEEKKAFNKISEKKILKKWSVCNFADV